MNARTSDRVSRIAARYSGITAAELRSLTSDAAQRRQTAGEIRTMAMSLLRQDEVKGLRRFLGKLFG